MTIRDKGKSRLKRNDEVSLERHPVKRSWLSVVLAAQTVTGDRTQKGSRVHVQIKKTTFM